jgi:hypothetical protein
MKTFGFTLTMAVSAMNEESAQRKLSDWLEPSLALKKNGDIQLRDAKALQKNLNVARSGETDEEDWDEEFEGLSWDDLGDSDGSEDEDEDDWEDDDDEELVSQEAEDDDFGLVALKALKSEPTPDEDDEEGENEQWGLTW